MDKKLSDNLEQFLDRQLERVNYWLSFAEAKNAALLAINVAVIAYFAECGADFAILKVLLLIALIISSLICLCSFFPNDTSRPIAINSQLSKDNLLFWKDIASLESGEQYLEEIVKHYFCDATFSHGERNLFVDFACEIVINSRITASKYHLFAYALWIDFFTFIFWGGFLMIKWM